MKLTSGVKIVSHPSIDLYQRLSINSGTENAIGFDYYGDYAFLPGAAKPKRDWRLLTEEEFSIATGYDGSNNFSNTISLSPLPPGIVATAREIGLSEAETLPQLNDIFQRHQEATGRLNEGIFRHARSLLMESKNELLEFRALCVTKPRLETLAFDKVEPPQYLGLHIDVSHGVDFLQTNASINRMCISFGSEERDLLIINKTILEIIGMLQEKTDIPDIRALKERALVRMFFDHYPDYPVIRLRQRPNELYLAPTDNIIHDGSTIGKANADIVLHARGYFDPFLFN